MPGLLPSRAAMANLVLVLACLALGVAARRWSPLPASTPRALNGWIFYVALPAMVLRVVHTLPLDGALLLPAAGLWLVFLLAAGLALLAVSRGWASREIAGALALTGGLSNTSFVGLPLLQALGGRATAGPALVADQLGSFLLLPLVAMPLAAHLARKSQSFKAMALRLVSFPPVLALLLAVALRPVVFPALLETSLSWLGDTLSPAALAAVGWQLELKAVATHRREVALGLTFKLLVAPGLVAGLVLLLGRDFGLVERVAVAQAAMAPMVTGAALASDHELSPPLASAMVALGVPLSLVTVSAWWFLTG